MFEWFSNNEILAWWLLAISIFSFIATLFVVPFFLVNLPSNYFLSNKRQGIYRQGPKLIWHMILILAKNLLGVVFILLGIALLVLPGQGLLTILIGLILLDFPGKYAAERWIIQQPAMFNAINWIRKKAGSDELKLPPREKI